VKVHLFYPLLATLLLGACANTPAPVEQMRLTEQALEQARAIGAAEDSAEFKLAVDKAAQARADMSAQAFKAARVNAEQAELDARLAEAKVLVQKSQALLAIGTTRVERLRKQLEEAR
jgi:hypothetical protein